jgi:peptidase S24-like protein
MREFSFVKQNILYFIEKQNISKYELYRKTGISNGVLSQKGGMSEENTIKFLSFYTEVSADWLLTGKGEMLKTSAQNITQKGNTNVNNGHNVSGQGNIIKQTNDELMEIIREKDKQIAEKDKQIAMLIEKISK